MEDYTKAQMFDITKEYINEYYQNPFLLVNVVW